MGPPGSSSASSPPRLRAGVPQGEQRIEHPLVELDALRERNVFLPIVSQIFLNGPYMAGLVITSLLLADVFNLGAAAIR